MIAVEKTIIMMIVVTKITIIYVVSNFYGNSRANLQYSSL